MAIAPIGAASAASAITQTASTSAASATKGADGAGFAKALENASNLGVQADNLAGQVATGQLPNIQAFTSTAAKAELAVDLAVAIRNRAIDAYQEIMRMSV
jgi:flagellar hook-basal body complex protein FliE